MLGSYQFSFYDQGKVSCRFVAKLDLLLKTPSFVLGGLAVYIALGSSASSKTDSVAPFYQRHPSFPDPYHDRAMKQYLHGCRNSVRRRVVRASPPARHVIDLLVPSMLG